MDAKQLKQTLLSLISVRRETMFVIDDTSEDHMRNEVPSSGSVQTFVSLGRLWL